MVKVPPRVNHSPLARGFHFKFPYKNKMKKKQTKQKIKEISLKILNIIGYVCIGLVLVLGILTGVNSCKNKQDQNAKVIKRNDISEISNINSNNYLFYSNKYVPIVGGSGTGSSFTLSFDDQVTLWDLANNGQVVGSGSAMLTQSYSSTTTYNLYWQEINGIYLLNQDGQLIPISRIYLEYSTPDTTGSYRRLRLSSIRTSVDNDNGVINISGTRQNFRPFIRNLATTDVDYDNYVAYYGKPSDTQPFLRQYLVSNNNVVLPDWITYFFRLMNGGFNITLSTFNPNGLYNYSSGSVVVRNDTFNPVNNEYLLVDKIQDYDGYGFFYSNNYLYTSIHIYWQTIGGGKPYQDISSSRGYSFTPDNTNGWAYFSKMEYWNDISNQKVVVCRRLDTNIDGITMPSNTIQWFDTAYQTLNVYDQNKLHYELNTQNLTAMNNNYNQYTMGFDNPFWLINMMFNSLTPLFNIKVLPFMSIGLLIAIPLIFIIVSVLINLFKK